MDKFKYSLICKHDAHSSITWDGIVPNANTTPLSFSLISCLFDFLCFLESKILILMNNCW